MPSPARHQQGFATLLTVMVILAIATLAALSAAHTTGNSTQIAGAQWTYQQAFSRAEDGLKAAKVEVGKWPINSGNSTFNCATASKTVAISGKYSATISCAANQLTIVSTGNYGTSNQTGLYAAATSKTSYSITGSAGGGGGQGGRGYIFAATGLITATSNKADIHADTTSDSSYLPTAYGAADSKGGNNKFSVGTQNSMYQLTQQQIADFTNLRGNADVTVHMSNPGNACDEINAALSNNQNASIIRLTPSGNGNGTFVMPNCIINNPNWWNAAKQTERIPTLIFDGDASFNGNAVQFAYVNVLVLGNVKLVSSLHITGSSSGIPGSAGGGNTLAATLKPGSWIDY